MLNLNKNLKNCESVNTHLASVFLSVLQTADLGLDIGAQGEPLGYRAEGKSPLAGWGAFRTTTGGSKDIAKF